MIAVHKRCIHQVNYFRVLGKNLIPRIVVGTLFYRTSRPLRHRQERGIKEYSIELPFVLHQHELLFGILTRYKIICWELKLPAFPYKSYLTQWTVQVKLPFIIRSTLTCKHNVEESNYTGQVCWRWGHTWWWDMWLVWGYLPCSEKGKQQHRLKLCLDELR